MTLPAGRAQRSGIDPAANTAGGRSGHPRADRLATLVERWSFYGILLACGFLLTVTWLEVASGGDSAQFHILDLFALLFIGAAATVTHRAFRTQRESQAATARAHAEMERFEAAETANLAKSRYLANVSHEIRSPLNAIYGYAQLVERDPTVDPREAARVIRRCAEHLTSLVEGLLDVSQIANGVLRVRSEVVRLAPFLEAIVAMMRPSAAAKGLEFVYETPARMPELVRMDPSRFRQVLINLISNAIKFTERGTVTLRLIWSGQVARFEIVDTGPGIAPEELERIFEPFERGRDEGKRALPGAGLGLSISRTIVEILGGKLEVESVPGHGTCFCVTMLLAEASGKLEPATAPHQLAGYEGPQRTVLIVDDEADQRHLIERLLTGLGFRVHAAPNGETALVLAKTQQFDLAILDISMPGLSGWETAMRLRDLSGPALRILMLSANSQEFHRPEFDHPVHDYFLTKPVDFTVLTETIGGLLKLTWRREGLRAPEPGEPEAVSPPPPVSAADLGPAALRHVARLRELLRIGYVRGIEAEIRELAAAGPEAEALAARLFGCLDRYDLAAMRRELEEA